MLHDAMCRVIAGDGGRCDESGGDHEPQPERLDECEQEVAGKQGREAGDRPDGDSAKKPAIKMSEIDPKKEHLG